MTAVVGHVVPVAVPAFRAGGEFTVGAEDELLLTTASGAPAPDAAGPAIAALQDRPHVTCTVSPEAFAEQLELGTPVCNDAGEVAEALSCARSALQEIGQAAVAVGVHPAAGLGDVTVTRAPRYAAIGHELAGFFRTPASSFQVHVGIPEPAVLVAGYRVVRNRLALLRALAAGSPFWHGRDSGLTSARAALLRSYPRTGVPPSFRSYEEYQVLAGELLAASEAPDYTYIWWDVRPHPHLGTLEVRVMDAQVSVAKAAGLVALVQGLVRWAAEAPPERDLPTAVLDENDFRAVRFGLDARVVDADGRMRPLRLIAAEAIDDARKALRADRLGAPLVDLAARLEGEQEYERHRRLHASGGMPALLADLQRRTTAPLVDP